MKNFIILGIAAFICASIYACSVACKIPVVNQIPGNICPTPATK